MRLREELEEQCRREVKNVQNEMRSRRAESSSLVESELQAAEVERDTLERKAKELLERAKKEKRDVEKQVSRLSNTLGAMRVFSGAAGTARV